jgi:hypothetical protein
MGRKLTNRSEDLLLLGGGELEAVALGGHLEGSAPQLGEIAVGVGDRRHQRRLEHLLKPLPADHPITENRFERQRTTHLERDDAWTPRSI